MNESFRRRSALARSLALLLAWSAALPADLASGAETRVATPGAPPPAARVADLRWLTGSWVGPGIQGALAGESWSLADEDRLVGHFFQRKPDGTLRFTELMMIHPVGDSIELRLKHFEPDLTGWEKQDGFVRFALVAVGPDVWYFDRLTIRRVDARHMTVTVKLQGSDGNESEVPFVMARQDAGG